MLKNFRFMALVLGAFIAMAWLGGLILGLTVNDGNMIAQACLFGGVGLSLLLWWYFTGQRENQNLIRVASVAIFSLTAGLAFYGNLAWILWALGFPMEMGIVRDGRMGEHYWLGPAVAVYAACCYYLLLRKTTAT